MIRTLGPRFAARAGAALRRGRRSTSQTDRQHRHRAIARRRAVARRSTTRSRHRRGCRCSVSGTVRLHRHRRRAERSLGRNRPRRHRHSRRLGNDHRQVDPGRDHRRGRQGTDQRELGERGDPRHRRERRDHRRDDQRRHRPDQDRRQDASTSATVNGDVRYEGTIAARRAVRFVDAQRRHHDDRAGEHRRDVHRADLQRRLPAATCRPRRSARSGAAGARPTRSATAAPKSSWRASAARSACAVRAPVPAAAAKRQDKESTSDKERTELEPRSVGAQRDDRIDLRRAQPPAPPPRATAVSTSSTAIVAKVHGSHGATWNSIPDEQLAGQRATPRRRSRTPDRGQRQRPADHQPTTRHGARRARCGCRSRACAARRDTPSRRRCRPPPARAPAPRTRRAAESRTAATRSPAAWTSLHRPHAERRLIGIDGADRARQRTASDCGSPLVRTHERHRQARRLRQRTVDHRPRRDLRGSR